MRRVRRCKDDRALLEGPHLLTDALVRSAPPVRLSEHASLDLSTVLLGADFRGSAEGSELAALLDREGISWDLVEDDLLAAVMDADSPRGVAAVARIPRPAVTELPRESDGVYVYADGLQDPGNLGALARSAESAGATALVLGPGCAHPNHPRALHASAGSLLRLPTTRRTGAQALNAHLELLAPRWAALATRGGESLWQADLEGCLVLAVGAEGPGLSAELERRAEIALTIPLAAPVESLNATVAASLVLFEVRRRRSAPD